MISNIGFQELYLGCFGLGFLFVAGSLALTGGRTKAAGHRGSISHGHSGGARGIMRAATGKTGAAHHGGSAVRIAHGNARGHGIKFGGARGAKIGGAHSAGTHAHGQGAHSHSARMQGTTEGHPVVDPAGETYVSYSGASKQSDNDYIEQIFFFVMGILNPMSLAMMIFFFGASGLAVIRYVPALTTVSYIPAVFVACLATMAMQNALGWFASRLENSALHILDDAVGSTGEVTVSIPSGKTGEVMFVLGQGRRNYSAKSMDPQKEIKRGTKVLIVELENNVVFVEPLDELYLDTDDQ